MIIDASALLAILLREEEEEIFLSFIEKDSHSMMSVASYLEIAIRINCLHKGEILSLVDEMIEALDITLKPVSVEQVMIAKKAHQKFGKGMGHAAQLNFGDCFTYALAKDMDMPLLFKGDDFTHTDLMLVA
uniref:Ribonuclease VapC n=1 Tax=Candidatus Kentrum sp. DK TaxID=2126562 RepID=A0A450S056_9GAMM|nr:MAG: ribonuclease VapC [Candidatus Kentron sp. DK]